MRNTFLALAIAILAAAPARADSGAPSEAVFPPQSLPIQFSHKQHLGFKLACDFCHEKAPGSVAASDDLLPSEDACRTCHKIERDKPTKEALPEARCDACHLGPDATKPAPLVVPTPNLRFNHKVHVDRKVPCQRCHGDMKDVELGTRAELPSMPLCLSCHTAPTKATAMTSREDRGPARCATCHLTRFDGTLETQFPSGKLVPSGAILGDRHGPRFTLEHAQVARQNEGYCESCHRRDFCLSCHNGVVKPMSFHGNDYLSLHGIDARKATTNCDGCHRAQTFCLGCHERAGVTDRLTVDAPNDIEHSGRRFHPPTKVWVDAPRTPQHHSWQAERNLRQCIACHREETCMSCHSASSASATFRVSPHPPGFARSNACKAIQSRNARVCLKCHRPTDPATVCE